MKRVRTTPRRPRCRSGVAEVCPEAAGSVKASPAPDAAAERLPESPSPGQSRARRGKPRPGPQASASPEKRAAARPRASDSVAAAAHHAPHLAHHRRASGESAGRKARANSGEAGSSVSREAAADSGAARPASRKASPRKRAPARKPPPGATYLPPGPAPADGRAFVEAVSARKNLVAVSLEILDSEDIRLKEKHLDRLLDLAYVKTLPLADEPPTIYVDLPRPDRSELGKEPSE